MQKVFFEIHVHNSCMSWVTYSIMIVGLPPTHGIRLTPLYMKRGQYGGKIEQTMHLGWGGEGGTIGENNSHMMRLKPIYVAAFLFLIGVLCMLEYARCRAVPLR